MTTHTLKKYAAGMPFGSGIYRFKDTRKKDLYVGKATNLKSRVNSYLRTNDSRIIKMVDLADSLEFISTESEIEALILESQLIKQFRPPFNIMLRDDKQYFYVVISNDKFPKVFWAHQPHDNKFKGSHFVGPFTDGAVLKSTLHFLRRIFPYCTCKRPHNNFCLNYHIGKCPGICCLKETNPEFKVKSLKFKVGYKNNIKAIKDILSGKRVSLVKKLEKKMGRLAKKGELEKAIELRNKISDLRRVFENARIIKNSDILKTHRSGLESLLKLQKPIIRIEGYDISNIQGTHATGSMVTFVHGQPDKNFYRKFKIYTKQTPDDTAMLKEILERRFKHYEWPFPDLVLIDGGKQQLRVAEAVANSKSEILNPKQIQNSKFKNSKQIPIIALTKNKKHIGEKIYISDRKNPLPLTKLSGTDKNLLLAIDSEAHRFAISYYRKLHRKLFR